MNDTTSTIKIGMGMLKIMAAVESMRKSIQTKIEAPIPMSGAIRLKNYAIEENVTKIYSGLDTAVRIQSAISSGDHSELNLILDDGHETVCPDMSILSVHDDSAANALKVLGQKGQQTNSTLLNQMESLFHSLRSEGNWIDGDRTTSVEAKLQELEGTIEEEMALIEYFIADLSDESVAI